MGIRSARLGPTQEERTAEPFETARGQPQPWIGRFVCVLALAAPGHPTQFFEGECRGEIVPEWRGAAGFGYDPVFLVLEPGKTFGEMPPEEKGLCSHPAPCPLVSGAVRLS